MLRHNCGKDFELDCIHLLALIFIHTHSHGHTHWHIRSFVDLPTIDANHDDAGKVEADAAGDDGIGGRQIQCACGILFAIILENQRLVRSMNAQRDGHKRDEGGQQPDGCNCNDSDAARYPAAISAMEQKE